MYYVYFARSIKNNKIYVGLTSKKPADRIHQHNTGSNKWSKQNAPFTLIYYETYTCNSCAKKREEFYKSGFGRQIKKLIVDSLSS